MYYVKYKTEFIAYLLNIKTANQTPAKVIRYIFLILPNNICMQKKTQQPSVCRQITAVFLILIFDSEFFEFFEVAAALLRQRRS